jgi:hypothetical protein
MQSSQITQEEVEEKRREGRTPRQDFAANRVTANFLPHHAKPNP